MEKITASLKTIWNGLRKTLVVHKQKCLLFCNSIIGSSHCCSIFFLISLNATNLSMIQKQFLQWNLGFYQPVY